MTRSKLQLLTLAIWTRCSGTRFMGVFSSLPTRQLTGMAHQRAWPSILNRSSCRFPCSTFSTQTHVYCLSSRHWHCHRELCRSFCSRAAIFVSGPFWQRCWLWHPCYLQLCPVEIALTSVPSPCQRHYCCL